MTILMTFELPSNTDENFAIRNYLHTDQAMLHSAQWVEGYELCHCICYDDVVPPRLELLRSSVYTRPISLLSSGDLILAFSSLAYQ